MPKGVARDDLFALFPDLPWHRHRTPAGQMERVQCQVKQTQVRASQNIRRQQAATEPVRAAIAARRYRKSEV